MNSAYVKMKKNEAKRERRANFIAAIIGWGVLLAGGLVGAAWFYAVTFMFLSLGA